MSLTRSLAGLAGLAPEAPTMLKRPLSGRRRIAWSAGVPLRALREAARQRQATVNDLLMSALTGGLRRVLGGAGERVDELHLRALAPVNLRPLGERGGRLGNHFGLVFLDLPVHLRSAEERLAAVRQRMTLLKQSPDAAATWTVLKAIGALGAGPASIERQVADYFTRRASLVATNVPGPRAPLHLGGHRLARVMFWVPHPASLGLGVSMLSYAGEVRLGVRADEAILERPRELISGMESELRVLETA